MGYFDRDAYEKFLLANDVIKFKEMPQRLHSGIPTYWKAEFDNLLADAALVEIAGRFVYNFSKEYAQEPTNFFGVPLGGAEFAAAANRYMSANSGTAKTVPATRLREKAKNSGTIESRYAFGPVYPTMAPLLVEDAGTTGDSTLIILKRLERIGMHPAAIIFMLNRQQRNKKGRVLEETLTQNYELRVLSMTTAERILPQAVEKLKPPQKILEKLRMELTDMTKYGVEIRV